MEAKDFLSALKNKYVWLLVCVTLLVFLIQNGNSAVGTYYFQYIVGDVTLMSTVGMMSLVSPFLLLIMPKLLQKISISQLFSWFFVIGAINSFANKLAGGLASGGLGLIMGLAGFDGTAEVITESARTSIVALYGRVPGALFVALYVIMRFFDLEKSLPKIREELAERRAHKQ